MTAKDYARIAAQAYKLAEQIKPADTKSPNDPFWDTRQLIVYHLRTGAGEAQRIADKVGQREGINR